MDDFTERFEAFTTYVSKAYKNIQKFKSTETERLGLKGCHVMCLYYLGKYPDGLTAADLGRLCNEDKAAISRTVLDLTEKGYILPSEDTKKKYRAILKLSPRGRNCNVEINQIISSVVEKVSQELSKEERDCFYKVFITITNHLDDFYK